MELTCPKCHAAMRQYERNGVVVDQCADCRGIFLDRGELERLVDAEARWNAGDANSRPEPYPERSGDASYTRRPEYRDDDRSKSYGDSRGYGDSKGYGYGDHHKGSKGHKRQKSFLEQLFD